MKRLQFALLAGLAPFQTFAAPASFTIDPASSSVSVSGTVAGAPVQAQGPGSLTTTYSGTGLAELTPTSVQFVSGSNLQANNSGNWAPLPDGTAGTAPANYGGRVNLGIFGNGTFAIRNLSVDGASSPLTLTGTAFPAAGVVFEINNGTVDFSSALGSGNQDLTGNTGNNTTPSSGSLTVAVDTVANTGTATLTLPLQATFVTNIGAAGAATLNLTGQVTGRVTSIGGDANFDRIVDIGDFATLAANFNQSGSWLAGNFDNAGLIDIGDFAILASNFNETAPGDLPRGTVPEPATGLLIAAVTLLRRRRFRM